MPFSNIEPRRLYRQIADQIRRLIQDGEFVAGARLPPERDLARQLGVSRPSVREALIALEVEGLVDVRIGSGIYVRVADDGRSSDASKDAAAGPFELLRARHLVESECAALAARMAKKGQLQAIEAALGDMQCELDGGDMPLLGDRLFHLRVAEATGNGALVHVIRMLWEERTGPLYKQLQHHYDSPKLWHSAMAEHRAVVEAIAARDAQRARATMQRHLDQAYKRFIKGWDTRN